MDKTGICALCLVKSRAATNKELAAKVRGHKINQQKGKESAMAKVKTCPCGKEFTAKPGNQKFCPECREEKKAGKPPKGSKHKKDEGLGSATITETTNLFQSSCYTCIHPKVCFLRKMVLQYHGGLVSPEELRAMCTEYEGADA